jgi:hypothetical protein
MSYPSGYPAEYALSPCPIFQDRLDIDRIADEYRFVCGA